MRVAVQTRQGRVFHCAVRKQCRIHAALPSYTHTRLEQFMNKDQVKGQFEQAKGQLKEATGKLIGDKTMENKGKIQDIAGKVQETYGDAKEGIKDAL
jgi:uncharacterized protein YjbJ (UPF0337 family)